MRDAQKASSIVVKNVALLLVAEVGIVLNDVDGDGEGFGPDHLVGAEHDAVLKASVNQAVEVAVEILSREGVIDDADVGPDPRRHAVLVHSGFADCCDLVQVHA